MPSGRLGTADVDAGTNTIVYTMTGGRAFNVSVNICNRNDSDVVIRLALVDDGGLSALTDDDWLEYDVIIRANGILERTDVKMAGYQSIVGYSDTSNVSFQVWS